MDEQTIITFLSGNLEKIVQALMIIGFMIFLINYSRDKKINKSDLDECIYYLYCKTSKRKPEYIPDQKLIDQFNKDPYNEIILLKLAKDIIGHCGYKPAALIVKIKDNPEGNEAGMYKIFRNASTIEIIKRPGAGKTEILATLIHECMHFHLRARGIIMADKKKNEYMTDIATVYYGFYQYMYKGYGRVGYLGKGDLKYTYKKINSLKY